MVYCSKCGYKNQDDVTYCVSCGAKLTLSREARPGEYDKMCFGGQGGSFWGVVFGAIIVIFGVTLLVQQFYGVNIEFWHLLIILVGILVIVGAIRRRRT